MTESNKKAVVLAVMGFTFLRLLYVWAEYFQFRMNMNNPLIPHSLIDYRLKVSIVFSILKCPVFIMGTFYLLVKKAFWLTIIICFLSLLFDTFLSPYMISLFMG